MKTLLAIRKGGNVNRFHTIVTHREHLVSSHSWGVTAIVDYLTSQAGSASLLRAALYHDVAEYVTGDVAADTKIAYPVLKETLDNITATVELDLGIRIPLGDFERSILRYADLADLGLNCLEELSLGNRNMISILANVQDLSYKEMNSLVDQEISWPAFMDKSRVLNFDIEFRTMIREAINDSK
jgi:5'-deoxynucleotidase YfbR-like HD superfamily hydrolase